VSAEKFAELVAGQQSRFPYQSRNSRGIAASSSAGIGFRRALGEVQAQPGLVREWQALRLHLEAGLSYAQVARALGVGKGAVASSCCWHATPAWTRVFIGRRVPNGRFQEWR
jgi:hypothetical protein